MKLYARLNRLSSFGLAAFAGQEDASRLAQITGTSMGKAKDLVATSEVLGSSGPLDSALRHGEISLDQAREIAKAEEAAPGAAKELLRIAKEESFHVLREKSRKTKLDAEQHKNLAVRQHASRSARSYSDELGMMHVHLALEPHIGAPIIARAEAEAERLARAAKKAGTQEDFERHLADAYANLFEGSGRGRSKRPELVVLVSHEVAKRGWKCVDCGNRFKTQFDHFEPVAAGGPDAHFNLGPRCWPCHKAKTERDRRAGKLTPKAPPSHPAKAKRSRRAQKLKAQAP